LFDEGGKTWRRGSNRSAPFENWGGKSTIPRRGDLYRAPGPPWATSLRVNNIEACGKMPRAGDFGLKKRRVIPLNLGVQKKKSGKRPNRVIWT